MGNPQINITQQQILTTLAAILEDMIADWDTEYNGKIGPDIRIVEDLEFESIDIVQFVVAIEEAFKFRGLPWEEFLMSEGRYVDDIKVGETVSFLHQHLNNLLNRNEP
ncbi:MAG: hypothetical protein SCH71_08005 [Desulfobulbaceae bacterium]|nr:hypothetical protein [Desulfobulbaceae bacterium]